MRVPGALTALGFSRRTRQQWFWLFGVQRGAALAAKIAECPELDQVAAITAYDFARVNWGERRGHSGFWKMPERASNSLVTAKLQLISRKTCCRENGAISITMREIIPRVKKFLSQNMDETTKTAEVSGRKP